MIPVWVQWWRDSHPEVFAGWVSLLCLWMVNMTALVVYEIHERGNRNRVGVGVDQDRDGRITWSWIT